MTPPRRAFAVLLLAASWSWAGDPAPAGQVQALWDKALTAFEKAQPVDQAVPPKDLEAAGKAQLSKDPAAKLKKLSALLPRIRALQAAKTPKTPECPGVKDPGAGGSACVIDAVRAAAAGFAITEAGRIDQITALYLVRFNGPKNQTPEEVAKAQARVEKAMADAHVPSGARRRMQGVMGSAAAFQSASLDGAASSAGTGPGYRGVNAAIAEARRMSRVQSVPVRPGVVPSLSERLSSSAREDEEILKHGQDDGTWGTAIGRAVTQGKKTGSELLSYFTSGATWRKTGRGAVDMVSDPVETARFLPGALKEAGGALWSGVKADIKNASDEVGEFIEKPTPYNGMKVVGSVGLAVSNAFVVRARARRRGWPTTSSGRWSVTSTSRPWSPRGGAPIRSRRAG